MMKRRKALLFLLGVVVLAAAAFLLLDFRVQQAEMAAESSAATYTFSVTEETRLPLEQDLDLYVTAPPELEEELARALLAAVRANPYVRAINRREGPPAAAANSVLVVEAAEPLLAFWSPFYTRTQAAVDVAYASDGQVDWIDEAVVRLNNQGERIPVVRVRAEHRFDGRAWGLISRPGYAHYLAEEITRTVSQALANTLASQGYS